MIRIKEAIVVEGRYDKNTLSQVVEAQIFETGGFRIMKDKESLYLLRKVAETRGLIVMTDGDGAGFVIRNFLKSAIPPEQLKHAYIPDVFGKERRKTRPGKEGKMGVEGMSPEIIFEVLKNAGATFEEQEEKASHGLTKADFAELGLSGRQGSAELRKKLLRKLGFPEHMSANAMLQALDLLYTRQELEEWICGEENG